MMKRLALAAAAAGIFIGSAGFALAQDRDRGMSEGAPGQEMHEHGSVPGSPGASGYTRGHDRDDMKGCHLYDRDDTKGGDRDDMKGRRGDRDHDFDRDRDRGHHDADRDHDHDKDDYMVK